MEISSIHNISERVFRECGYDSVSGEMVSDVCENDIFSNSVMVRRIVNGVTPISEVWQKNGVRGFMNETLLRLAGARYREKEICSLKDLNAYPEIKLLKNYTSLNNLYPQAPIEAFHIHDDEYGTSDISGAWDIYNSN